MSRKTCNMVEIALYVVIAIIVSIGGARLAYSMSFIDYTRMREVVDTTEFDIGIVSGNATYYEERFVSDVGKMNKSIARAKKLRDSNILFRLIVPKTYDDFKEMEIRFKQD